MTDMPADLDELEELARAATPGPWTTFGGITGMTRSVCRLNESGAADTPVITMNAREEDARYIAAANPAAILALIARVRAAEEALTRTREDLMEEAQYARHYQDVLDELGKGDGVYYVTQERAFAPGIAGQWPEVIPAPHTPHGRLVKRQFAALAAPAQEVRK